MKKINYKKLHLLSKTQVTKQYNSNGEEIGYTKTKKSSVGKWFMMIFTWPLFLVVSIFKILYWIIINAIIAILNLVSIVIDKVKSKKQIEN